MKEQLTILIPTSPIPSHPSTAILDETISNIRKYTDARIVIMADGIHPSLNHRELDYRKYIDNIGDALFEKKYGNCNLVLFNEHSHQSIMTSIVLEGEVFSPLIMFCEADTSPIGEIPFNEICNLVKQSSEINYVRFNIFDRILPEHEYLMLDRNPQTVGGIPITRTIQWSQRPHIAKTEWYKKILQDYFSPLERMMIEDRMHGIVIESYKEYKRDLFGLAIYTPEGNQLRSYHADGRGSDKKIIGE